MLGKTVIYCLLGSTNGLAFVLWEAAFQQGALVNILMFVGAAVVNVAAFHAVTKVKFENIDKWQKDMAGEWKQLRQDMKAIDEKAGKVADLGRRIELMEQFQRDLYNERVPGIVTRFRHRETT